MLPLSEAMLDHVDDLLDAVPEGVLAQRPLQRGLADLARLVRVGEVVVEQAAQLPQL